MTDPSTSPASWQVHAFLRRKLMDSGVPRWNLTQRRHRYDSADAVVVSIPKSGRTWLRLFLSAFASRLAGHEPRLDPPGPLDIEYTHDRWQAYTASSLPAFAVGEAIIPPHARRCRPVVLLARDPRDVIVSLYFHLTRRTRVYTGSMSQMIRDPLYGLWPIIRIMNTWMDEWGSSANSFLVRYEDCRANTREEFGRLLRFLHYDPDCCRDAFDDALKFSHFERAQASERASKFSKAYLTPTDPTDIDSFKVRRGKVGGFSDYLNSEDVDWANDLLSSLDPRYGYP